MLATQAWVGNYATQFYTNIGTLNISANSSSTSSFASGSNILITNQNQYVFNSLTPQGTYQMTLRSTSTSNKGIYLEARDSMIYIKNNGNANARASLDFEDDMGAVYEYGIRNSAETARGWYWYCFGSYRMVLRSNGYLGVGTITPSVPLEVFGSASVSMSSYFEATSAAYGTYIGSTSRNISIRSSHGILASSTGLLATSDRRAKTNIRPITDEMAQRLLKCEPVLYNELNDESQTDQIGMISQDILDNGLKELVASVSDEYMEESEHGPAGVRFTLEFSRLCPLLLKLIQSQQKRIDDLENRVSMLIARPAVKRWINKYTQGDASVGSTQEQSEV